MKRWEGRGGSCLKPFAHSLTQSLIRTKVRIEPIATAETFADSLAIAKSTGSSPYRHIAVPPL